jgi:hypothetical protein
MYSIQIVFFATIFLAPFSLVFLHLSCWLLLSLFPSFALIDSGGLWRRFGGRNGRRKGGRRRGRKKRGVEGREGRKRGDEMQ